MQAGSRATGVNHNIDGASGAKMPVGQVVAWIRAPSVGRGVGTAAGRPFRSDGRSWRATPLARSLARVGGVDLLRLRGSGPGGRIVGRDVPATSASSPGAADTKPRLHLHWW